MILLLRIYLLGVNQASPSFPLLCGCVRGHFQIKSSWEEAGVLGLQVASVHGNHHAHTGNLIQAVFVSHWCSARFSASDLGAFLPWSCLSIRDQTMSLISCTRRARSASDSTWRYSAMTTRKSLSSFARSPPFSHAGSPPMSIEGILERRDFW